MSKFSLHIGHETAGHETRDNSGLSRVPKSRVSRQWIMQFYYEQLLNAVPLNWHPQLFLPKPISEVQLFLYLRPINGIVTKTREQQEVKDSDS